MSGTGAKGAGVRVAGLILAGGLARRMGGRNKALLELAGRPLVAHVLERLRPQVAHIAISANDQVERLRQFAVPVLPDVVPGHAGPLAGVLTGLQWLRETHPEVPWLLSVAVDTPFFPPDLCARMLQAVREHKAEVAMARCAGRSHPVFGLWPRSMSDDLRHALCEGAQRGVAAFLAERKVAVVEFAHEGEGPDPFFNINTPSDLTLAEAMFMRQKT